MSINDFIDENGKGAMIAIHIITVLYLIYLSKGKIGLQHSIANIKYVYIIIATTLINLFLTTQRVNGIKPQQDYQEATPNEPGEWLKKP